MHSGPPKAAEAVIAFLVPPACREEVLGDLHERYRSPGQYSLDALRTVPLIIISRIRRTADPYLILMQAFALYLSCLGAASFTDRALLQDQWGLLRLAPPAVMTLLGLILEDAYAKPGPRSAIMLVRGPVLGLGLAFLSQGVLWVGNGRLAVPPWTMLYGGAMSLFMASTIRMMFRPITDRPQGANGTALWLKQEPEPPKMSSGLIRVLIGVATIAGVAIIGTIGGTSPFLKPRFLTAALIVFVAYQLRKRG